MEARHGETGLGSRREVRRTAETHSRSRAAREAHRSPSPIHSSLKLVFHNPSTYFISHGELPSGILFKAPLERVRIDLQGNRLVAASVQKPTHVEFRKTWDAKLPILLHVDEFVKQQSIREWFVRNHDI